MVAKIGFFYISSKFFYSFIANLFPIPLYVYYKKVHEGNGVESVSLTEQSRGQERRIIRK